MNQHVQPGTRRLYDFLREIYGNQLSMTRVEVDVEALSGGGVHGTAHREATEVRAYTGDTQLLPDFEGVPYWKEILAADPGVFHSLETHQDRLDRVQELLEREGLYADYGLDWPDVDDKTISPLHFTLEELSPIAGKETGEVETLEGESDEIWGRADDENRERSPDDAIACAESALATLSKTWVQNVFGDAVTDVLFDALNMFQDTCRLQQENLKLNAASTALAHLLQQAVNTISFMLLNLADAEDHLNPTSGEIYSDVVRGALCLEEAIKAGIIPDNYEKDGVAGLIKEVKAQEALQAQEDRAHHQLSLGLSRPTDHGTLASKGQCDEFPETTPGSGYLTNSQTDIHYSIGFCGPLGQQKFVPLKADAYQYVCALVRRVAFGNGWVTEENDTAFTWEQAVVDWLVRFRPHLIASLPLHEETIVPTIRTALTECETLLLRKQKRP